MGFIEDSGKTRMKTNPRIQEIIAEKVIAANIDKEPSGRLSASRLGHPLQWQMLNYYKVPQKPIDEYTLRKFQRGKDVEERIMKWLAPDPSAMQVEVNYRGVAGVADVILEYPIEVKSVTNMAFKYKQKEGASRSHRLQGELYALARGFKQFAVAYVASDDYRVLCFEYDVSGDVNEVIDAYETQKSIGTVPAFEALEKWQGMGEYNPYPEWKELDAEGITKKLSSMGVVVPGGLRGGDEWKPNDLHLMPFEESGGPGKGENGDWSNQD